MNDLELTVINLLDEAIKHGKHNQASHGRRTARRRAYSAAYSEARAGGASPAEARAKAREAGLARQSERDVRLERLRAYNTPEARAERERVAKEQGDKAREELDRKVDRFTEDLAAAQEKFNAAVDERVKIEKEIDKALGSSRRTEGLRAATSAMQGRGYGGLGSGMEIGSRKQIEKVQALREQLEVAKQKQEKLRGDITGLYYRDQIVTSAYQDRMQQQAKNRAAQAAAPVSTSRARANAQEALQSAQSAVRNAESAERKLKQKIERTREKLQTATTPRQRAIAISNLNDFSRDLNNRQREIATLQRAAFDAERNLADIKSLDDLELELDNLLDRS